jgi:hypothetical protein
MWSLAADLRLDESQCPELGTHAKRSLEKTTVRKQFHKSVTMKIVRNRETIEAMQERSGFLTQITNRKFQIHRVNAKLLRLSFQL